MRKVILFLVIIILNSSCQAGENKIKTVADYYEALRANDGLKWQFTTDTLKLWFEQRKGAPVISVAFGESTGPWREWDQVMNATSQWDSLWLDQEDGEKVVKGFFYENNDFYRLLGKSPTKTLRTFWFDPDGKIKEILIYWIPEENTETSYYLEPIAKWAYFHDSVTIAEIYPGGKIIPSKENALKWKQLLNRYNQQKE